MSPKQVLFENAIIYLVMVLMFLLVIYFDNHKSKNRGSASTAKRDESD